MNNPTKTLISCIKEIGPIFLKGKLLENAKTHRTYQIKRYYPANVPKNVRFHIVYLDDLSKDFIMVRDHEEDTLI